MLNGGSLQPGFALNTYVTIKGSGLATNTRTWGDGDFNGNKLPTNLDGTTVMINNQPAFVYYISSTQLNVLSPIDTSTGAVSVQVTYNGQTSNTMTAQKAAFSPAFFIFNNDKYIAARHADFSLLGPTSLYPGSTTPAKPGDTILLYGTGFGQTTPATPNGQIFPGASDGAPKTANNVTVRFGGTTVSPSFAGLTATGEFQINVQVPDSAPNGDIQVIATVGGVSSLTGAFITVHK